MTLEKQEVLEKLKKSKTVALFTHNSPDVDGLSSMFAFKELLTRTSPDSKTLAVRPQNVGPQAIKFLERYDLSFDAELSELSDVDALVVFDTSSIDLMSYAQPYFEEFQGLSVIIDHHHGHETLPLNNLTRVINEDAVSTTQIVFEFFKTANEKPSHRAASVLASGIVTDSAFFTVATPKSFQAMSELLALTNASHTDLLANLKTPREFSERVARLKASKRLQLYSIKDVLIATSQVGSHEASAAMSFIGLGADVSFVLSQEKDNFIVSSRASNAFISRSSLNLGELMSALGAEFKGSGGGHAGAAAFNFTDEQDASKVLRACAERVLTHLKDKELAGSDAELKKLT